MTDLREAAQQALDYWEQVAWGDAVMADKMDALRAALAESEPPKTPWAHLPNAAHIDRILAHAKAHPHEWAAAKDRGAARDAAWSAARAALRGAAWNRAYDAFLDAAQGKDWSKVWGAIAALIAWDYAGELFSLPPEQVKAMANEGECAAVLIYPAMLAMREDK